MCCTAAQRSKSVAAAAFAALTGNTASCVGAPEDGGRRTEDGGQGDGGLRMEGGGKPTQHADEEGLVNQLVALRVQQVELEGEAASLLPLLMAVVQQTCGGGACSRTPFHTQISSR